MNKEIKEKWIAALESGDYPQTTGHLKDNHGYCCLGVLCDIYSKEVEDCWKESSWSDEFRTNGVMKMKNEDNAVLPNYVAEWAGLSEQNPIMHVDEALNEVEISILNDEYHLSFSEIAQLIKDKL